MKTAEERRNMPFVFSNDAELCDLGEGVRRKILSYGNDIMLAEVHFEEGAEGKLHIHPHTQITYVLSGEFEFTINGVTKIVKQGDAMYDAPNVQHGCRCIKAGVLLDVFSPAREDFI